MESLFSFQFPAADKDAWRIQVQKELRDTATLDSLRWQPEASDRLGDFMLEPYYTANDLTALPVERIQAAQKKSPGWLNAPPYTLTSNPKADNLLLRHALERGADALVLTAPHLPDFPKLLDGIKLSNTPVYFRTGGEANTLLNRLRSIAPYQLRGGLLSGRDQVSPESLRLTADSPHFCPVGVSSHRYHNAGATVTQELAFTLAALADQYDNLTDAGFAVEALMAKTLIAVSVGTGYFIEIAKLRALRVLWNRFLAAYNTGAVPHLPVVIQAQTSSFYDASRSPYTNMLRATTEALAAVVGGCDVLTVRAYDDTSTGETSEFAGRIARNVSILLKEESYLDKVADPSAGSYYIETLTHEIAEAAWALFLRVETMGGLAKSADFVRSEIEVAYQAKVNALTNGRVMVGVNKFREEESIPANPIRAEQDLTGLLPNHRLAVAFE